MSISGSLKDVAVSDVLQFICIGQRTGTLELTRGRERARLGFHLGKLVGAQAPGTPKLGDMLVASGLINHKLLAAAVVLQRRPGERRSLGQILVATGSISPERLREVIENQIRQAIGELLTWDSGDFHFVPDGFKPIDDIALYPSDVIPDADLNTQMVLLEATRIFDERSRKASAPPPPVQPAQPPLAEQPPALPPASATPEDAPSDLLVTIRELQDALEHIDKEGPRAAIDLIELQVVSPDAEFTARLEARLRDEFARISRVPLHRAGDVPIGAPPPVVLADLRPGGLDPERTAALHHTHPRASIVALVHPGAAFGPVYAAGVIAAVPAEVEAVAACIENVIKERPDLARARRSPAPSGVDRLRRAYGNLRSGLMSATTALNLMHSISESVERAVLFLVKRDELAVLGAFGRDPRGLHLAVLTRGLRFKYGGENAFARAIAAGDVQSVGFVDGAFPEPFRAIVGAPRSGQSVIFPVAGAQRVIAVIYTDNGDRDEAVQDIEILELAAAQAGMAFENELLRRQIVKPRE